MFKDLIPLFFEDSNLIKKHIYLKKFHHELNKFRTETSLYYKTNRINPQNISTWKKILEFSKNKSKIGFKLTWGRTIYVKRLKDHSPRYQKISMKTLKRLT